MVRSTNVSYGGETTRADFPRGTAAAAVPTAGEDRGRRWTKSDPQRYWLRPAAGGDELCARTPEWACPSAAQTTPGPPVTSPSAAVGDGRAAIAAAGATIVSRVVDTRQSVMAVSVSVVYVLFEGSLAAAAAAAADVAADTTATGHNAHCPTVD